MSMLCKRHPREVVYEATRPDDGAGHDVAPKVVPTARAGSEVDLPELPREVQARTSARYAVEAERLPAGRAVDPAGVGQQTDEAGREDGQGRFGHVRPEQERGRLDPSVDVVDHVLVRVDGVVVQRPEDRTEVERQDDGPVW